MNGCWTFFATAAEAKPLSVQSLAAILLPNRETQAKFPFKRKQQRDQGLLLVPDVGAPSGHSVQSVLIPTPLRKKTHLSLSYGCISKGANHALKAEVAAVQQRLRPVSVYGMSFFCNCKCASRYSGMEPRSAPPPYSPASWREASAVMSLDEIFLAPPVAVSWRGSVYLQLPICGVVPSCPYVSMTSLTRNVV